MKKHQLTILWMLLLTLPIFAETSLPSKTKPAAESAIGSNEKIDWADALPMLSSEDAAALGQIVDEQIDKAFAEGYKAAELRFEPELTALRYQAQSEVARFREGFCWGLGAGVVVTTIVLAAGGLILGGAASR